MDTSRIPDSWNSISGRMVSIGPQHLSYGYKLFKNGKAVGEIVSIGPQHLSYGYKNYTNTMT